MAHKNKMTYSSTDFQSNEIQKRDLKRKAKGVLANTTIELSNKHRNDTSEGLYIKIVQFLRKMVERKYDFYWKGGNNREANKREEHIICFKSLNQAKDAYNGLIQAGELNCKYLEPTNYVSIDNKKPVRQDSIELAIKIYLENANKDYSYFASGGSPYIFSTKYNYLDLVPNDVRPLDPSPSNFVRPLDITPPNFVRPLDITPNFVRPITQPYEYTPSTSRDLISLKKRKRFYKEKVLKLKSILSRSPNTPQNPKQAYEILMNNLKGIFGDDLPSNEPSDHPTNLEKNSFGTPKSFVVWMKETFFGGDKYKDFKDVDDDELLLKFFYDPVPLCGMDMKFDKGNIEKDVLVKDWLKHLIPKANAIFVNPPYNGGHYYSIEKFVDKALETIKSFKPKSQDENPLRILFLIPFNSKSNYFGATVLKDFQSITFLPGITFTDMEGNLFQSDLNKHLALIEFSSSSSKLKSNVLVQSSVIYPDKKNYVCNIIKRI